MLLRAGAIGEEAGAFEHQIDAEFLVRQVGWIALGGNADALAVDHQIVAVRRNPARIFAVDRIPRDQPGGGLGVGEAVTRVPFPPGIAALAHRARHPPPEPSETAKRSLPAQLSFSTFHSTP